MTEGLDQEQMVKEDLNVAVKKEIKEENDEGGVMEISAGYKGNMTEATSNRNPPQRCPRPLDSQETTQGGHTITHNDQRGDLQDCTTIKQEIKEEEMEDQPPLTLPDGSSNRNPPERCPHPLNSQDLTQEGHNTPHYDQSEILCIKVEDVKNEEDWFHPMVYQPCKTEEIPSEISKDGGDMEKSSEERFFLYSECKKKDDVTDDFSEKKSISTNHGHHSMDRRPSHSKEPLPEISHTVPSDIHHNTNMPQDPSVPKLPSKNKDLTHCDSDKTTNQTRQITVIPKLFHCAECGKRFAQQLVLEEHQKIHTMKHRFPCSECWKSFPQKSQLVSHQRTHTGERPYTCSECGKCFAVKSQLIQHLRVHTGERPFPCEFCGKFFNHQSSLAKHLMIHTGERPYPCSECNKSFSKKSILVEHLFSHSQEKPYPCPECGKHFRHKANLERHRKIHNEEKPFSCPECGKCFRLKTNFVRHLSVHSDLRPFQCLECEKCFKQQADLHKHQKIHRDVKPFLCTTCGKTFSQSGNLSKHQKIHRNLKPFPCTTCGKPFAEKSQLAKHQNVHREVKPFLCTTCDRTFIRKSSYKNHQKTHNGKVCLKDVLSKEDFS